jgi:RimJ/RimL family protein N-acetyltransferase
LSADSLNALPRIGPRVVLRRLTPADLPDFQSYRHDVEVGRYQGWLLQSDEEASKFIADMNGAALFSPGRWVQIGVAYRNTNLLIGDIGIFMNGDSSMAEIGFTLSPSSQGMGLGTEAVREALTLIFTYTSAERVVAVTDARNLPSIRLLERVGMARIETVAAVFRGEPCEEHRYEIARRSLE